MSLYFNWSCDFQRFTKSKKLSKFQVRTTTFVLLNKSLSTSLFNLQGTIRCFKEFSQLFVVLNRSSTAYLVYQNQKRLSRTFFKFFFRTSIGSKPNFSVLRLSLRDKRKTEKFDLERLDSSKKNLKKVLDKRFWF